MTEVSRRAFTTQTLLLSACAALSVPEQAMAVLDIFEKKTFLHRDDIGHAIKSIYITYDGTSKYLHKFNDVVSKTQLRSLQFHIDKGLDKDYVDHYIATMKPVLQRIKQMVAAEGAEKGLASLFENNSSAYQLFERINVSPNQRSFPCPYQEAIEYCRQFLGGFTITWENVCSRWCSPTWTGFADQLGIKVSVHPGETCEVRMIS